MKNNLLVILLIVCFILPIKAIANNPNDDIYNYYPTSYELLEKPVKLTGKCKNVSIIEWRVEEVYKNSEKSNTTIDLVDKICNITYNQFESFISIRGFKLKNKPLMTNRVSIIPYDINYDGTNFRNLNDTKARFKNRPEAWENGIQYSLNGYTIRTYDNTKKLIFVRNDILDSTNRANPNFMNTFSHELFHALSYHYGVYNQISNDNAKASKLEEELAQQFTKFMGLG